MTDSIIELKDFKDYLPLEIDITDKNTLIYNPTLAPTSLKLSIEPALTEEELYNHMKEKSHWSFENNEDKEYYRQDCINFLRDVDFQSFSQYGKMVEKTYIKAKQAYLFDCFLRNYLLKILERIEVFLKKSTSDALTISFNKTMYIFEDDDLYFDMSNKYGKDNIQRKELVLKTKYHLSRLILEKKNDIMIKGQIEKYGVVLPWTVFRLMTFGNLASFLIALQPLSRNKVAEYVSKYLSAENKIPAKILLSWCNALRYLRNICSHNDRLFGRLHHTLPAIHRSDENLMEITIENDDKKLFVYFISMRHLILCMSKESKIFWNNNLQKLSKESAEKSVNLGNYGFPENWVDLLNIHI